MVVARACGAQHAVADRQVEVHVVAGEPSQAGRHDRDAVVTPLARDELLLRRLADRIEVVPHHLDRLVVRLGPRVGEHGLFHAQVFRFLDQSVRKLNRRLVGAAVEELIVGQLLELPCGGFHQPGLRETK